MPYKNLETRRRNYKAHPEKYRESIKKWQDANPEKIKIKSKRSQSKPRYKILKALSDARRRCTNIDHPQYKYYGAKGIQYLIDDREMVVAKLLPDFIALTNNGLKPSLDRIDSTKHYSIDNIQILEFVANSTKHLI
jgi:hypothetical protein